LLVDGECGRDELLSEFLHDQQENCPENEHKD
jgi:hypothetical protein